MIDLQLMHIALAGIGMASAAALLVAALILAIATGQRDRRRPQAGPPASPAGPAVLTTAPAPHEPALR